MSGYRFDLGDFVMCNLGPSGWKLGRVIALHYRERGWPAGQVAPYQVALEENHELIYVPEDDERYCREPTREDVRISRCLDALAESPIGLGIAQSSERAGRREHSKRVAIGERLGCAEDAERLGSQGYRNGKCLGCDCCPQCWSSVELYSQHYRCAERTGLVVTHHAVDLGTVRVGDSIPSRVEESLPSKEGFMQCPTLARLPPGVHFRDNGRLSGEVRFDPHRDATYNVDFVAVSTINWDDPAVGLIRLEVTFVVEGNEPPSEFDVGAFRQEQESVKNLANRIYQRLGEAWELWELGQLDNHATCDRMCADLSRLRNLLEQHPRLEGGLWWAQLGGYYMNVHKLLENTLFECELYLGHALTFGDSNVRWLAEQNLAGCYQKRLLEAARFLWIDGLQQMMRGQWSAAAETLHLAAAKRDGWGWAVNFGDIWFSESAARLVHGAELATRGLDDDAANWIADAIRILRRGEERTEEAEYFGVEGHPWASELKTALASYQTLRDSRTDVTEWLDAFKLRTTFWCAQVLGGAPPFPPSVRPRREDAAALAQRLRV
ncbi:MAG: hypothetical protein AAGI63_01335 [Planctomycetota bacterium]